MIVDSMVIDILQGKSVDVTAIFDNPKFKTFLQEKFIINYSSILINKQRYLYSLYATLSSLKV